MKLLITSIYFINDFQVYLNLTKLENLIYQYEDTIIVFIHTNLYKQNLINKDNEDITLNNLYNLKGGYKGYRLNLIFYKKMLSYLLSVKHEINEIKIHVPNDKFIRFNAEILLKEISKSDYQYSIDNNINRHTEDEVFEIVDFDKFEVTHNIEKNMYQVLAYFQYRMDLSFFIKKIFLQKSTISLSTINLDVLMIMEMLNDNESKNKNINIITNDDEEKYFINIKSLIGFNYEKGVLTDVVYNYVNLAHYLKINFDKNKIELVKPQKFKKYEDTFILEHNNNIYLSDFPKDEILKIEKTNYFSITNIIEYMTPYNSLNNIIWNLRELSSEFELNNDNFIINTFNDSKRIRNLIKKIKIKSYIDKGIEIINENVLNEKTFNNFIKTEYTDLLMYFLNDLNLNLKQDQKPICICPNCSNNFIYDNEKVFFCMECDFKLFKNVLQVFKLKDLTRPDMKNIGDKSFLYKRMKNKSNKMYYAKFILNKLKNNTYNLKIVNNQGKYIKNKPKEK